MTVRRRIRGVERLAGPLLVVAPGPGHGPRRGGRGRAGRDGSAPRPGRRARRRTWRSSRSTRGPAGSTSPRTTVELSGEPFRLGVVGGDARAGPRRTRAPRSTAARRSSRSGSPTSTAARSTRRRATTRPSSSRPASARSTCWPPSSAARSCRSSPAPACPPTSSPRGSRPARGCSARSAFVTVFAAMGITRREADFFRDAFASSGVARPDRLVPQPRRRPGDRAPAHPALRADPGRAPRVRARAWTCWSS